MIERRIKLETVPNIEKFNKICSSMNCDVDLASGKYYVDAKSVLGIYSLNLSLPLTLFVETDDERMVDEKFKEYIL